MSNFAKLEDFTKPIPCEIKEYESEHFGTVLIRQMSRSESNAFQSWLRPKGKVSEERDELRDLKIVTMSVVDGNNALVFDCETDEQLRELNAKIQSSASAPWDELIYGVMEIQGYYKKVDSLLGK